MKRRTWSAVRRDATECNSQIPLPIEHARSSALENGGAAKTRPAITQTKTEHILWMRDVVDIVGVHRCTIHRWIQLGRFPAKDAPRKNPVGWLRSTIHQWLLEK